MSEIICPLCETQPVDGRSFYFEDERRIYTCKECYVALMNIVLLQKLHRYRAGDPRKLLKQELARDSYPA